MNVGNLILLAFIICAVYSDLTQTKISNRLIGLGLMVGAVFRIWAEGGSGILFYIVNISIPVILLYLLFQMRALGAGDIKLFSMIGAFLSTEQLLQVMVLAFCVGAVFGILKIGYQCIVLRIEYGKFTQIHFSTAILVAYIIVIWR